MKRLARAATAWIWADVAVKIIGAVALGGVLVAVWSVLLDGARVLGL